jgi:dihydroorotase
MHEGEYSALMGLKGLPGAAEDLHVSRDIMLAELTGARVHIAHISTARSVDLARQAKRRGLNVTCEVAPHHFTLTDRDVYESRYDTNFKMAPPLRSQTDLDAVIEGLRDGTIDAIATDHAPHHANEKMLEFDHAPNGVVGLETAVSLTLDRLVHRGVISLTRMVELLSCNPARIFKLDRGTLKIGAVADVTIFDPEKKIKVDAAKFQSKQRLSMDASFGELLDIELKEERIRNKRNKRNKRKIRAFFVCFAYFACFVFSFPFYSRTGSFAITRK